MAAPTLLRCPQCNAPINRVEGKDTIECPYCKSVVSTSSRMEELMRAAQAPRSSNPVPYIVVGLILAVVAVMGSAAAVLTRSPPPAPPVIVAPTTPAEPPKPPPPPEPPPKPSPLKQVLSFGEQGRNPGQLDSPFQLAVASDGSIFVSDHDGRVQRFGADGAYQQTLEIPKDKLTLQLGVFGMAADAGGKVYINRVGDVLVYDAASLKLVRTIAGSYPDRYFHGGLAVDGVGTVFGITDRTGDLELVSTNKAGMHLSRARVDAKDVAVDGSGRLFLVGDDGLEVRDAKGAILSKVGGVSGRSLAYDGKDAVYVATGSGVEVLKPDGTRVTSLPLHTSEIAVDTKGRLYAVVLGKVEVYEVTLP